MRDILIFIASSVREFKSARWDIAEVMERLNRVYKKRGVEWIWNRPETESRMLNIGGSQLTYDEYIRQSEVFVLIIGRRVGFYTEHEYEVALEQFAKTGKPKILPCFLDCASDEAEAFRKKIQRAEIGVQFVDYYENLADIKSQIQWELINYETETANLSYDEAQADAAIAKAKEWAVGKVHSLQEEISTLKKRELSPDVIAEITRQYAEMVRIVRKYEVEPDALLDYMGFLWQQHLYETAIEVGHWLENYYSMDKPGDDILSLLKNRLGLCYADSNQYEQAERYYREELEIKRRLAAEDPMYEANVALTCNNLGTLLSDTKRMEEAKHYYGEALEIELRLAKDNVIAFAPDVALTSVNLGNLLCQMNQMEDAKMPYRIALETYRRLAKGNPTLYEPKLATTYTSIGSMMKLMNRMEEAETHYLEALEIWRRFAKANPVAFEPNLAATCNNLGELMYITNRMDEAEKYYKKAVEIRRCLVKTNPAIFQPDLARTYVHLGAFEADRENRETASLYFKEALSLYEKFPQLEEEAQKCRTALNLLDMVKSIEELGFNVHMFMLPDNSSDE